MALVLINGPDNAPSTAVDWDKVNDVLQTIGLDISNPTRIKDGYIHRGSVLFFAGAWYVADSDTAVTGVQSDYIKLVNTAGVVTAEYVAALVDVTFNRTWNGWYDPDGNMYLFDEMKALANGEISELATMREWRPTTNWSKALTRDLSNEMLDRLFSMGTPVTLTDSGTWTVPAGVYYINVSVRGPGSDGTAGGNSYGGAGGNAGQVITESLRVVPGQEITYSVGATTTVFDSITATKGTGQAGGAPYGISYQDQVTYAGGNGGGGVLGSYPGIRNAQDAPANSGYGGGGGAGGSHTTTLMRAAGSGALGRITIS